MPDDPRSALTAERLREQIAPALERDPPMPTAKSRITGDGSRELALDKALQHDRAYGSALRKRPRAIAEIPERIRGRWV